MFWGVLGRWKEAGGRVDKENMGTSSEVFLSVDTLNASCTLIL